MSKRKNKQKKKNKKQQVIEKAVKMYSPGRSKHQDKAQNGGKPLRGIIYSVNELKAVISCGIRFVVCVEETVEPVALLEDCRRYVPAYLEKRIADGMAADTIHTEASNLAKLYGCAMADFGVKLPPRLRGKFVKNRSMTWRKYYNPKNHPELELVCDAFGVRRCEVQRIVPQQVKRRADGSVYLVAVRGKGGKIRDIDAYPPLADAAWALAQQAIEEGWSHLVPYKPQSHAPMHQRRGIYAWSVYLLYARPIEDVPYEERYYCRRDMAGIVLDKQAMWIVAKNLGHERLNVVINYFAVALEIQDAHTIEHL